ncbi:MAG: AGE family epimerase/isomerase, partial [Rhodanobacteraceae bacterium]
MSDFPDFRSPDFLKQHIQRTMAFYHPHCLDPAGGCFHYYKDDGTIYDRVHRHLVSSARFVFDYAMYARYFGGAEYLDGTRHCVRYLRDAHRQPASGGYAWTLTDGRPDDTTNHCYGVAFVLVAYANAYRAGIADAGAWMDETWYLLEEHFWEPDAGLYRDDADAAWRFSDYRGQNANMHMCEAMLAAFEASRDRRYLDRAYTLADNMTRLQAAKAGGLVWEHYDENWEVDWNYHRDDPKNLFRPWGF